MPGTFNYVVNRNSTFTGVLEDSSGNAISITAGSVITCRFYRGEGNTPDLTVNGTPLSGGSATSFTAGTGNWQIFLASGDTDGLTALTYTMEVDLTDAGDSNREKIADRFVVNILGQPG